MHETHPSRDTTQNIAPGTRFGLYRIVREVGRGGMGVVFLAEQEDLGRRVALKVLAARHAASEKALERFEREVRAVARLNDPNIVAIYDVGRVDGQPFFTMEYVEGRTLHDVLQELRQARRAPDTLRASDLTDSAFGAALGDAPPPPLRRGWIDAASYVVAQIADALSHVHSQGIVHRDVKPKNILLARDGRVLLFDFGVARVDTEASMTVSGEFVGTPFYVSPEQVDPPDDGVDERTDIYSLGVTLYEALALEVPFDGDSPQQIFKRVCQREAKPIRRANPLVPRDLETVCAMAMAKERGRRYQSAADFAADLRRFLELKPVFARPLGPLGRVALWMRRKPALAALVAAGIVLLALTAFAWQQRREIRAERAAKALASFRNAQLLQRQGNFAEALLELASARAGGHDEVEVAVVRTETLEADGNEQGALAELTWLRGRRNLGANAGKVALLAGDLGAQRLRDPDAGIDLVASALASGQLGDADASYARALLAENAKQALAELEQVLARDPHHVRARAAYGPTLLSLGRRDEATRFAERTAAAQPDDVRARLFAALAHALSGNVERASVEFEHARRLAGPLAQEQLEAWAAHLSAASQGSAALLEAATGGRPVDAAKLLVAVSNLFAGLEFFDVKLQRRRTVHFLLPPAVARGYAKLVQVFAARGVAQLSEADIEPTLSLLDQALAVHPDGFRYLLRGTLGRATRGTARMLADLEDAARTPSVVAIERAALFLLLRAHLDRARTAGGEGTEALDLRALLGETFRRVLAVARIEADAFPFLIRAAREVSDPALTLELALRWARESPQTMPASGLGEWLSEADHERVRRLFAPR